MDQVGLPFYTDMVAVVNRSLNILVLILKHCVLIAKLLTEKVSYIDCLKYTILVKYLIL